MKRIDEIQERMTHLRPMEFEESIEGGYGLIGKEQSYKIEPIFDSEDIVDSLELQLLALATVDVPYLVVYARELEGRCDTLLSVISGLVNVYADKIRELEHENSCLKSLDKNADSDYNMVYPTVGEK